MAFVNEIITMKKAIFGCKMNSVQKSLTRWNGYQLQKPLSETSISRFLEPTLRTKYIKPCEKAGKTVPGNVVRNCVHYCLRSLVPFKRCETLEYVPSLHLFVYQKKLHLGTIFPLSTTDSCFLDPLDAISSPLCKERNCFFSQMPLIHQCCFIFCNNIASHCFGGQLYWDACV